MKIDSKILAGVALGAAAFYGYRWWNNRQQVNQAATERRSSEASRAEKEEFIIEHADTSKMGIKPAVVSGFDGSNGDKVYYNPYIGYMVPTGTTRPDKVAFEPMSNAAGEPTDNPVEAAKGLLSDLSDSQIETAYLAVTLLKDAPTMTTEDIIKIANLPAKEAEELRNYIVPRLIDITTLKSAPDWEMMFIKEKDKKVQGVPNLLEDSQPLQKGLTVAEAEKRRKKRVAAYMKLRAMRIKEQNYKFYADRKDQQANTLARFPHKKPAIAQRPPLLLSDFRTREAYEAFLNGRRVYPNDFTTKNAYIIYLGLLSRGQAPNQVH